MICQRFLVWCGKWSGKWHLNLLTHAKISLKLGEMIQAGCADTFTKGWTVHPDFIWTFPDSPAVREAFMMKVWCLQRTDRKLSALTCFSFTLRADCVCFLLCSHQGPDSSSVTGSMIRSASRRSLLVGTSPSVYDRYLSGRRSWWLPGG